MAKPKLPRRRPWIDFTPKVRCPPLSGHAAAVAYLHWRMARDGIAIPKQKHWIQFYDTETGCEAHFVTQEKAPSTSETYLTVTLPAWAMPMPRVDLWHEAHQAGLPLTMCAVEGTGCYARWDVTKDLPVAERAAAAARHRAVANAGNANAMAGWALEAWHNEQSAATRLADYRIAA